MELLERRELKKSSKSRSSKSSYTSYYYNNYYNSYTRDNCDPDYEDCSAETWVVVVVIVIIALVVLGCVIYKCSKFIKKKKYKNFILTEEKAYDKQKEDAARRAKK